MAPRSRSTSAVEDAPTALAPVPSVTEAMTVAEGADRTDRRGKENIEQRDLVLPRIALAQRTSPQLDPGKDSFIKGLQLYEMFNTLTGQVYGTGPVDFVIVRHTKRAMEFDPETNKVIDFNVPLDDPRLDFTTDARGNRVKPRATLFQEFLIVVQPTQELLVLSMKGTQLKTASTLLTLLQVRPGAAWHGLYRLTSSSLEKNGKTVATFRVTPQGKPDVETMMFAESLYDSLKDVNVRAEHTTLETEAKADPDAIPF